MNENELKTSWVRFIKTTERKYIQSIKRILDEQVRNANSPVNSVDMFNVLLKLRRDAAVTWGYKIKRSLKVKAIEQKSEQGFIDRTMGFSERIYELMKAYFGIDLLNESEGISDTTREYIRISLSRGALLGQSFDEIVRGMSESGLNERRARVIARTETIAAANKAGHTVAKDSGLLLDKKWLAIRDKRTRRDHVIANGQIINNDEYFKIGGYDMMAPGDRGGKEGRLKVPGREIINCRCTLAFIPKLDANGRIMMA